MSRPAVDAAHRVAEEYRRRAEQAEAQLEPLVTAARILLNALDAGDPGLTMLQIGAIERLRAALSSERTPVPRNHAPWCSSVHDGPCPAKNEPAPTTPITDEMLTRAAVAFYHVDRVGHESLHEWSKRQVHAALDAALNPKDGQ